MRHSPPHARATHGPLHAGSGDPSKANTSKRKHKSQTAHPTTLFTPQSSAMAPRTRLQAAPERRVRYNSDSEAPHRQTANPTLNQPAAPDRVSKARGPSRITRQHAPESETSTQVPTFAEWATARETPDQTLRVPAPHAVPRGARGSRNQAAAPLSSTTDKKSKVNMKLCVICYHEKGERSFRPPKDVKLCQHFSETCRNCIERTVRSLIDRTHLNDGDLKCWHYECTMVIPYVNIKDMISPGLFHS
jgi:hypothetical protein